MSVAEAAHAAAAGLQITPLSPTIGAEIAGIDMGQTLAAEQQAALYQALLDWKVVFFRDQDISREQHLEFAREIGPRFTAESCRLAEDYLGRFA